jgi:hypothetical protein
MFFLSFLNCCRLSQKMKKLVFPHLSRLDRFTNDFKMFCFVEWPACHINNCCTVGSLSNS